MLPHLHRRRAPGPPRLLALLGIVGSLAGCGTLVTVSGSITPPPPSCFTPRPATAADSFTTKVAVHSASGGLQIGDIRVGCGRTAVAGRVVHVQFTGWLDTGAQVGTSRTTGQEIAFTLGDPMVTPLFWNLGVPGMQVGGTRRLVVPPALAFGATGNPNAGIPSNATIVIDIELVALN